MYKTYANGSVYKGEWKDGKENGQGEKTDANGNVYEGEFKDDKTHGQGKMTHANGDVYKGQFKNGMIHGQGKYILTNFFGLTFHAKYDTGVAMHGIVHFGD